ncbi:BMP family lipoprotein [Schaalia canis]|uniref:BMP family ABC transporter substrate-binding protein n=1 Tax=Schaalia canis TaxID=100469 RepID=A0A3P1SC64_9ACTO|nr:BMP family ABC transporter substrate-binding protein [Schaalia canis]RRC94644.1 BMP family ABC transporter substrate-binding protein [Schaalia canis]
MKNSLKFGAVAAAAALALAACGAAPDAPASSAPATDGAASGTPAASGTLKACMVSDAGGFEDKSFNQSGKEGLEKAKAELGVEVSYSESHSAADFTQNIDAQIQGGCQLVFGVGFLMAEAMNEAAKANPEVMFALVDSGFADSPENAKALLFNTAEASYLAGYAAAGMTTTGKVGTFLGMQLPSTAIFADGFSDGIAKYNEVHGGTIQLLGWDKAKQEGMATGDFEDTTKGKQFSTQLIEQGADIIMPVAGPVGAGTLAAATETGKASVVWVDADGYLTQPESGKVILTSVMKQIGAAVFDTVKTAQEGKWDSAPYVGTLANGGVGLAPFHDFDAKVSAELKKEIEDLQAQIVDGTIKVESAHTPK